MERVLDLIAVLALLAIYVWGFSGASVAARVSSPIEVSAAIAAAAAAVLMALMWILATHPERIGRLVTVAAGILPTLPASSDRWSACSAAASPPRASRARCCAIVWSFPRLAGHCRKPGR